MLGQSGSTSAYIPQYVVTELIAALAAPLWYLGGAAIASCALVVAAISFIVINHLVRQVRKANEQRLHLDQQLMQSQKLASIGELSSGIAHEINNPLAVIGQEVEWMRHILHGSPIDGVEGLEELRDSMREIGRQVERCGEITHKLLDFARKTEPLIQGVDVNKLIEDMARLVEKESILKNITIVRDYQKDMPAVYTDGPLLRQVVLNLLNNARQAIGKDGVITVITRISTDNSVDLKVVDTGCGVPTENLSKIFDPFFTTKPPGEGTGLGLSICHGIIDRLGGRISVESELGKGTTFSIDLPLKLARGQETVGRMPEVGTEWSSASTRP
jgi:two-component system, NtrC family, sensor kinase